MQCLTNQIRNNLERFPGRRKAWEPFTWNENPKKRQHLWILSKAAGITVFTCALPGINNVKQRRNEVNMKKINRCLLFLLAGNLLLTGCGRVGSRSGGSPAASADVSAAADIHSPEAAEGEKEEVTEPPSPTSGVFTPEQGYSDPYREVSIVGLKEYTKIKTDRFTDKAKKGKKYLVLFLKVRNRSSEKIYFNVNYLSAKVDGKEIENTFLLNEPEGYPTIFSNIVADSYYGGFIVWEVPKKWKKVEVVYEGWRDSDGLTLKSEFTKKDLKEPEEYSKYTYDQGSSR